jgi:competence protein ComEC
VAVALITGDRAAITPEVDDAFRASSLAHILSISGMHMSIVCGLAFLLLRVAFSLVPPIALRWNVKKCAGVAALLLGAFYLALADFPTPAVRAFVMVAFFFLAVLLDREALTLRSLTWAATGVLLVEPSALAEPGFQMSFAATFALVLCYRRFAPALERGGALRRAGRYLAGIISSSLIASAATAPFIAFHFNQFSAYGVLANLLALPLLSAVIMPGLLAALALHPLGLAAWPLAAAEEGVRGMIRVARYVAEIPGAVWYVPPIEAWALLAVAVGMGLALLTRRRRLLALAAGLILAGAGSAALYVPPDLLIAPDGRQLALRLAAKDWVLVRGKSNRNFVAEQWQQRLGVTMRTLKQWQKAGGGGALTCTETACVWHAPGGRRVTLPFRGKILAEWEGGAGNGRVTWPELDARGAHALWFRAGEAVRVEAARMPLFFPMSCKDHVRIL